MLLSVCLSGFGMTKTFFGTSRLFKLTNPQMLPFAFICYIYTYRGAQATNHMRGYLPCWWQCLGISHIPFTRYVDKIRKVCHHTRGDPRRVCRLYMSIKHRHVWTCMFDKLCIFHSKMLCGWARWPIQTSGKLLWVEVRGMVRCSTRPLSAKLECLDPWHHW